MAPDTGFAFWEIFDSCYRGYDFITNFSLYIFTVPPTLALLELISAVRIPHLSYLTNRNSSFFNKVEWQGKILKLFEIILIIVKKCMDIYPILVQKWSYLKFCINNVSIISILKPNKLIIRLCRWDIWTPPKNIKSRYFY